MCTRVIFIGNWVWINARGKITNRKWKNNGSPEIMSGTYLDISKRKAFEEELNHKNLELTVNENYKKASEKQFKAVWIHKIEPSWGARKQREREREREERSIPDSKNQIRTKRISGNIRNLYFAKTIFLLEILLTVKLVCYDCSFLETSPFGSSSSSFSFQTQSRFVSLYCLTVTGCYCYRYTL